MSAAGRGTRRAKNDAYVTPSWCVDRLYDEPPDGVPLDGSVVMLEPCAGNGEIIRAIKARRPQQQFVACELRPACEEKLRAIDGLNEVYARDFLLEDKLEVYLRNIELVITNPPYKHAMAFIRRVRQMCPRAWIVFLLRVNFLASQKRAGFMRAFPPDVYVLPNRPSFRNGSTDATEYAWFVWQPATFNARTEGRVRVLGTTSKDVISLAKRRRRRKKAPPPVQSSSPSSRGKRGSRAA